MECHIRKKRYAYSVKIKFPCSEDEVENAQHFNTINLSKPKIYFIYRQFIIQQFYILPTMHLYVCVDL
jgi:hypothetical protein